MRFRGEKKNVDSKRYCTLKIAFGHISCPHHAHETGLNGRSAGWLMVNVFLSKFMQLLVSMTINVDPMNHRSKSRRNREFCLQPPCSLRFPVNHSKSTDFSSSRCETGKNCLIKTVSLNIWQTNIPNTMISVKRTMIIEDIQSKVTVTVFFCRYNSSSTAATRSSTRTAPAAKELKS